MECGGWWACFCYLWWFFQRCTHLFVLTSGLKEQQSACTCYVADTHVYWRGFSCVCLFCYHRALYFQAAAVCMRVCGHSHSTQKSSGLVCWVGRYLRL